MLEREHISKPQAGLPVAQRHAQQLQGLERQSSGASEGERDDRPVARRMQATQAYRRLRSGVRLSYSPIFGQFSG
jgi:hypothetical protein